ncbi:MAG: response regulator transcription factor [Desulfosarcinaceae bacterium]|nr:response regulator transcription factor [Desulfosarcinaceae bacterium]
MRLLLIEDDRKIARFVKTGLREAGFVVDHAVDGEDGLHYLVTETYDTAIVDLMLPGLDGLSIIREIRSQGVATPILILSAKRSVDERVEGLVSGGDDYLTKPFAFTELLARVQALVRRSTMAAPQVELQVADLRLNLHTRDVFRGEAAVRLQPLEFALLAYLMRHAGRIVSKTMIIENVWDYNFNPGTNVVESKICYLREKVDRRAPVKLIHTIRGVGYVLKEAE